MHRIVETTNVPLALSAHNGIHRRNNLFVAAGGPHNSLQTSLIDIKTKGMKKLLATVRFYELKKKHLPHDLFMLDQKLKKQRIKKQNNKKKLPCTSLQ